MADLPTHPGAAPPPLDTMSDSACIATSLAHPEEFAAIFDRHAAVVHRYLARRLGTADADDLLGEVFLIAFE